MTYLLQIWENIIEKKIKGKPDRKNLNYILTFCCLDPMDYLFSFQSK